MNIDLYNDLFHKLFKLGFSALLFFQTINSQEPIEVW